MKEYYKAYDLRYKTMHDMGLAWATNVPTPIVPATAEKYGVTKTSPVLEIGCGEGRDAFAVLKKGYDLTATDVSAEAIDFCRKAEPKFSDRFFVADCLKGEPNGKFSFIYSVAVIHMLVSDDDRKAFYGFIRDRLLSDGLALVCSMGDGVREFSTDTGEAFNLVKRQHYSGEVSVASTSCRVVTAQKFESEITANGLEIVEKGLTSSPPEFDSLMYAVVRKM